MNAPIFRPASDLASTAETSAGGAALRGIARHISAEGCQFVIVGKVPSIGRPVRLVAAPGTMVTGTIRWVLGDRVGFAFDQRIDAATVAILSDPLAGALPIELLAETTGQEAG